MRQAQAIASQADSFSHFLWLFCIRLSIASSFHPHSFCTLAERHSTNKRSSHSTTVPRTILARAGPFRRFCIRLFVELKNLSSTPSDAVYQPCINHRGITHHALLHRFSIPSPHIRRSKCPTRPSLPTRYRRLRSPIRTSRPRIDAADLPPTCKRRRVGVTSGSHHRRSSRLRTSMPLRPRARTVNLGRWAEAGRVTFPAPVLVERRPRPLEDRGSLGEGSPASAPSAVPAVRLRS